MSRIEAILTKLKAISDWKLWLVFFVYSLGVSLLIQLVLLPYVYSIQDAGEAKAALEALYGDAVVFVGDEFILDRLLYLGEYQNPQPLDEKDSAWVYLLIPNQLKEVPEGAYVLVSYQYLSFVLGITPPNWDLIQEFSHSSQQTLFMYHVAVPD